MSLQASDEVTAGKDAGTKADRKSSGLWVLTPAQWNCGLPPIINEEAV